MNPSPKGTTLSQEFFLFVPHDLNISTHNIVLKLSFYRHGHTFLPRHKYCVLRQKTMINHFLTFYTIESIQYFNGSNQTLFAVLF